MLQEHLQSALTQEATRMGEGARVWLVPDGYIPEESTGAFESH